mgnify:CR=1 FL=1
MVQENYRRIEERVAAACRRCGRERSEVTLIAVSKTKPVSMIRELMDIGVRDFGENHAQELVSKTEEITEPLNWHFIGNLQRNKVKYVVGRACLIHSVNSLKLAEEIEKEAARKHRKERILVEVNIASEDTKTGISGEEAVALVKAAAALPDLTVCGLMAVAPPTDRPEENRRYFREMRLLRDKLAAMQLPGTDIRELSMGMTGDFEIAIEEGATLVRVGTAIFGARNYDQP